MKDLYTIETKKSIDCLGGIVGPLTTPTQIEFNDALRLVAKGFKMYKHNPHDLTEKVLVTRANINSIKFTRTREEATSKRLLNRSIQDMDKPLVKEVVNKEVVKVETSEVEKIPVVTKERKDSTKKNETNKEEKVTKPDGFSK